MTEKEIIKALFDLHDRTGMACLEAIGNMRSTLGGGQKLDRGTAFNFHSAVKQAQRKHNALAALAAELYAARGELI